MNIKEIKALCEQYLRYKYEYYILGIPSIDDFEFDGRLIKSRDKEKLLIRQQNVTDVIFLENIHELFASIKK